MKRIAYLASMTACVALVGCSSSPSDDGSPSSAENEWHGRPGAARPAQNAVSCNGEGFQLGVPTVDPRQSAFTKPDVVGDWVLGGGDMPLGSGTISWPGSPVAAGRIWYEMLVVKQGSAPQLRVEIVTGPYEIHSTVDVDLCSAAATGATYDPIGESDPIPLSGTCDAAGLRRIRDAFGLGCP